ncbi:hypothetical protein EKK58_11115 [Candidatus Dependentiae bacterium]|nr:MAG: hypothetical protein EKK58_11115 [Candidatus Dependentiae bacterium]
MVTTIEQRYYDEIIKPSVCFDNYNVQQYPTLKSIIEAEKHGYTVRLIEDWLRGLPSACTIPFYDDEIIAMGYDLDFYWNTTARVLYKVARDIKHPKTLPRKLELLGCRWFDRVNGNTYFAAAAIADSICIAKIEFEYGYGDHWLHQIMRLVCDYYNLPALHGWMVIEQLEKDDVCVFTNCHDTKTKKAQKEWIKYL